MNDIANVTWVVWLLLFAIWESVALATRRAGDTLSERTRAWFHTNTRRGRIVFGAGWCIFSLWFLWHILWQ